MIYYTSDTHFSHKNIIKYENRPFKDVEEMDNELIKRWNNKVTKNDDVYIIGDFAFKNHIEILKQLNGRKHLILGNHDFNFIKKENILKEFDSVDIYKEITDGKYLVTMFHYPIKVWDKKHYGAIHLYGHIHTNVKEVDYKENEKAYNVGCDVNNYEPKTLKELMEKRGHKYEE